MYRSHACAPCHPGTPWRHISTLKDRQHPAWAACGVPCPLTRDVVISSCRESQRQQASLSRKKIEFNIIVSTLDRCTFLSRKIVRPVTQPCVYWISAVTTFTAIIRHNGTLRFCHVFLGNPSKISSLLGLPLSSTVPEGMLIVTPSCQHNAQLRLP